MKTNYTITLFLALILSIQGLQAKVIIVNNNTGQPVDNDKFYGDLQEAINEAEGGDIIYLVGSPKSYGEVTISDKSLILIGPGYFLGENEDINTQATDETAKILRLYITGKASSNTVITGIDNNESGFAFISIGKVNIDDEDKPENIVIQRNNINRIDINYAESTLVRENLIDDVNLNRGASQSMIWYNIVLGRISESGFSQGLSGTYIKNNTLNNGLSGVDNAKVENNIFITGGLEGCFNNTVQDNVFTIQKGDVFPEEPNSNTDNDNDFGKPASSLFQTTERKLDRDYQLAEDSPAKNAGINDTDAGAFTEDPENSYKISGLPAVPAIYELKTNGVGTPDTGMKVTIKAKSHN